jgi:hypothetical protein
MVDIENLLEKIHKELYHGDGEVVLEGENASIQVENELLEAGLDVVRYRCPVLLRSKLRVTL